MDKQEKGKIIEAAAEIAVNKLSWICYMVFSMGLLLGLWIGHGLLRCWLA